MRGRFLVLSFVGAALLTACQGDRPEYPAWSDDVGPPPAAGPVVAPPDGAPPPAPLPQGPPVDYGPAQAPNAAQIGAAPSPQLIMPSQEGAESLTTAAEAPLHTLNLVHEHIPPVLLAALADPYAYPEPLTCEALATAIDRLTVALGPDFDRRETRSKTSVTGRGGLGLQLMNGAAGSLLPFHSILGALTGSTKHDELIIRALAAGAAQRAYLKGLGESRGCPDPASPLHAASPVPPVYDGPPKPRYPAQ
jgi:hypothetical protein